MDTNFCNLLNIWDKVFKTYQNEQKELPIQYGITRKINARNFWDVYFGEVYYLFIDIKNAPGVKNKLLYIIMPPGGATQVIIKPPVQQRKNCLKKEKKKFMFLRATQKKSMQ